MSEDSRSTTIEYKKGTQMQPLGRKPIRFPCKRSNWLGKGVRHWWESHTASANKKACRRDGRFATIEYKKG